MSCTFDSGANKVVISYRDDSDSYQGTAIVGTVSGTSISFGTEQHFEAGWAYYITSCFDSNSNKTVIAWKDNDTSYGNAAVATISGTDISFGTPTVFESASTNMGDMESMAFDSDTNQVVIAYSDVGNSSHGTAVVGEIDGTDISFGTPVVFEAASTNSTGVAYDTNANKIVISYRDAGDSSYGKAIVGTVSGDSISFGTASAAYDTHSSSYFHQIAFDPSVNKLMVVWEDYASTPSINFGTYKLGTISGTDITFGDKVVINYAVTSYLSPVYDPDSGLMVIAIQDGGDSRHGKCVLVDSSVTSNFLSWIGIAGTGVSDGATVKVNLLGTINENQSSLTIGSKYYMQNDGSVTTTSVTNRQVGMATATTKLFVTAGSIS